MSFEGSLLKGFSFSNVYFKIENPYYFLLGGDFHGKRKKKGSFLHSVCDKYGDFIWVPLLFGTRKRRSNFK